MGKKTFKEMKTCLLKMGEIVEPLRGVRTNLLRKHTSTAYLTQSLGPSRQGSWEENAWLSRSSAWLNVSFDYSVCYLEG